LAIRTLSSEVFNNVEDIRAKTTQDIDELSQLQNDSLAQRLPEQKVVFKTESIKSRAGRRDVRNLPDPTNPSPEPLRIQNPVKHLDHAKREVAAARYYDIPADVGERAVMNQSRTFQGDAHE
jgi:hypothetical protein